MTYPVKNFSRLLGTEGLSDRLLQNHFALYEGYVKNVNVLTEKITQLMGAGAPASPEYAELKRRFGWEFNGMRLHELYFSNIKKGGSALSENSQFSQKITRCFGSFEKWQRDFKITGSMRGIGWVVTTYDEETQQLLNVWINEHDEGHLAGLPVLLIMDVFEHAYMVDYGLKKADYIEAFMKIIDWDMVCKRFNHASAREPKALQEEIK